MVSACPGYNYYAAPLPELKMANYGAESNNSSGYRLIAFSDFSAFSAFNTFSTFNTFNTFCETSKLSASKCLNTGLRSA